MQRSASLLVIALFLWVDWSTCTPARAQAEATTEAFAREVERVLPEEQLYDYHKRLSEGPVHVPRRDTEARKQPGELELPERGWKLVWCRQSSPLLQDAVRDFQDYLEKSMQVRVELDGRDSLEGWLAWTGALSSARATSCPAAGQHSKLRRIMRSSPTPERLVVCGYDERGAMYGLYNLEARMNLREGPFLPADLKTVRHSLYDVRMVMSWMGWMEWPDALLSHLAHDGFDGIFASAYANPNGDRSTAESSTDFYARLMYRIRRQEPARVRDLIQRAARFGIKVYAPIIYQYQGTPESEAGLRRLVRDWSSSSPTSAATSS